MTSSENRQDGDPLVRHLVVVVVVRDPDSSFQLAPSSTSAIGRAERASDRSDPWSLRLGPDRCDRAFPMRSLLESGAEVALVSDFPVARFDPREGLAATCVPRRSCSAQAPDEEQGVSALNALHGLTTWAAVAVGEKGALMVGAGADLTIFGVTPVECPADDLTTTRSC